MNYFTAEQIINLYDTYAQDVNNIIEARLHTIRSEKAYYEQAYFNRWISKQDYITKLKELNKQEAEIIAM